jgi:hypothetical protein
VFAVALAKADGVCFAFAYDLRRQKNGERLLRRSPPILELTSVFALRSPNWPAQIDLIGPRHRTGSAANGRANQHARRPS